MKQYFASALLLLMGCPLAQNQSVPTATAGNADLRYALRYSETVNAGGSYGTWHTIDTSGSLDYANGHARRPFSLGYSGGYASTLSGPSYGTGAFHRLLVTQEFDFRKWMVRFRDDVGYRPQSPTTGFSGIPGTGEPIGDGSKPASGQLILALNTHAMNNEASGEVQRIIGRGSSINAEARHGLLRYPDGNGIDSDDVMASVGPTLRLNARSSFTSRYAFSRFAFSDSDIEFQTNTVMFGYSRSWNRAFHSTVSAGPEWVLATSSIPGSTGVAAQAALTYQARRYSANLSYSRATSGGSGYVMGAKSDSVNAGLSRLFAQAFTFEIAGGYRHTSAVSTRGDIAGEFGSVQGSWRIGRHLNAFANYSAMSQSSSSQLPSNVLNQLMQVVSFGISFSKDLRTGK